MKILEVVDISDRKGTFIFIKSLFKLLCISFGVVFLYLFLNAALFGEMDFDPLIPSVVFCFVVAGYFGMCYKKSREQPTPANKTNT